MSDSKNRWTEAYNAILDHVKIGEPGSWKEIQESFPDVPSATFWRYVRKARSSQIDEMKVSVARKRISSHVEATTMRITAKPHGDDAIETMAPGTPSVAVGYRQLNLLGHLGTLFDDIEMLRAFSLNAENRVKHPHFFAQAISMREKAITSTLRCTEAVWDLQRMWDFYDAVVAEVGAVSPEVAEAIMKRLGVFVGGQKF